MRIGDGYCFICELYNSPAHACVSPFFLQSLYMQEARKRFDKASLLYDQVFPKFNDCLP